MLTRRRPRRLAMVLLGGLCGLGGCPPAADQLPSPIDLADGLRGEYVMSAQPRPSALAAAEDGRVFYTEQKTGRIRVIKDGTLLDDAFAEVRVNTAGDNGLLGLALHPRFASNHRLYVFYTRSSTGEISSDGADALDNRVVYFTGTANSDVASTGEVFVATLPVSESAARIGGRLAFAADRTLFVALGDLTSDDLVQDATTPYGKILRYNDDGTIPADNPTADSATYAVGLRDPHGLTFNTQDGAGYVLDRAGQGIQEIHRLGAGANFGWPAVSGIADSAAERAFVGETPSYVEPLLHTTGQQVAFAGLAFNPGLKYGPGPQFKLFYGDVTLERVRDVSLSADGISATAVNTFVAAVGGTLVDVGFTPAGAMYLMRDDAILRVVMFQP